MEKFHPADEAERKIETIKVTPADSTSRKAAAITLKRIAHFSELNRPTKEEADKIFLAKTRKLWKEFAVHGVLKKEAESGKRVLQCFTDLDGKASLGLLKLAKIKIKDVQYVIPGEFISGRINIDTGYKKGVVVEEEGLTAFFDHHAEESSADTSATSITYEVLTSLGLLEKEEYLDKLVEFVTQIDNNTFPDKHKYFKDSYRTLLGLYRFIKFENLKDFFEEGLKPTDFLDFDIDDQQKDLLRKFGLLYKDNKGQVIDRLAEQKRIVVQSIKEIARMEKEGFIIPSEKYGKIAIDINKKVPAGADAAYAENCGVYLNWSPETKSFFICSMKELPEFKQGIKVRGNMWIKPDHDLEPLKISLREILMVLTDNELKPAGELKKYLEENK